MGTRLRRRIAMSLSLKIVAAIGLVLGALIALFGWLNRCNDTMATDLEDEPLGFGREHLAAQGWDPGKHAHN